MPKDFVATITNPERRAEWLEVFGIDQVYLQSPVPVRGNAPGKSDAEFYLLDLKELTEEQTTRLISHLSRKFDMPHYVVLESLEIHGVPILAEDCTVAIHNPQRWFDDYDDFDEDDEPDEFEAALQDCGFIPGSGCTMAGTEYCDWDCPLMDMWIADEDDAQ